MKLKITLFLSLAFVFQLAKAQDKVYTKEGTVVELKVVEQTNKYLKYKMIDYLDGPIRWFPLEQVEKIEYKNGFIDYLKKESPRMKKPFSVSLNAMVILDNEGIFPSLNAGYFIFPQIELSANFTSDFVESYMVIAGPKFHLCRTNSSNRLTSFLGILIGTDTGTGATLIPVGLNYATKKGFNTSLSYNFVKCWGYEVTASYLEIGIGWRF